MKLTEGDIEIDIPDAVGGGRFDGPEHGLSRCMKAVDFVMELADRYLFIELKDPQHPRATTQSRNKFKERLHRGVLDEDLKYKYRDSFLYEWAAGRADKPIYYFVLVALDTLDEVELLTRTEALARNLPQRGPDDQPWLREIVCACGVFNIESWNRKLPHYPVNRVGAGAQDAGTTP